MNIRMKIFLANAGVSLVLLTVLTLYMSAFSSNIILDKAKEDAGYSISQLSQNIDTLLQTYEQIVDSLYVSTEMQNMLLDNYNSFAEVQQVYLNYIQPYEQWITTSRELLQFSIYTDNPTFQYAQVHYIDEEVKSTDWYRSLQGQNKTLVKTWTVSKEYALLRKGTIRLAQKVHNSETNREMYTVIDIEDRMIHNLISRENESQRYIIALPNHSIVVDTSVEQRDIKDTKQLPFYNLIEENDDYSDVYEEDGKKYLLTVQTLDSRSSIRGLKVIQMMPIDELFAKVNQMKDVAFILLIASGTVSIAAIYFISLRMTKRLMEFARQIKTMDIEKLTTTIEIRGNDEIGQLSHHFQQMMMRINQLIKEVYQADILKKEFELYALQAQINPHYLFNTLNAIRGSLLEKGDRENAEIIKLLALSFRKVLSKPSELNGVGEELEVVDTFLKIQVFRFGTRLRYSIDVPPDFLQLAIPRLSLQTLIENTIVHALEQSIGVTEVTITAERYDDHQVRITVSDNGPGLYGERLQEILAWINEDSEIARSNRVGLRNIHQRLQRTYGGSYGLQIESVRGQGTQVSIIIPDNTYEGGDIS